MNIGLSKKEKRLQHWKSISTRVTTHEGEFLSGEKGRKYQIKYSGKYLGKDLGKPFNPNRADIQRELVRTKWENKIAIVLPTVL